MTEERKFKITNSDKIKKNTIELCQDNFAQKLITNNQFIDFSWKEYPHEVAMLAKMIIPDYEDYGKYKKETIQKMAYDTAINEIKSLMKEITDIGPLPERTWNNDNEIFKNIFFSCTHNYLVSWPILYFREYGKNNPEDPEHNSIEFIKKQAMEKAKYLTNKYFPENLAVRNKLLENVSSFFDQLIDSAGKLFFMFK